jgi:hypothetical protein
MELTETVLTDLYTWCFNATPDTILFDSAASADGVNTIIIKQVVDSYENLIWDVKGTDASHLVSSFETTLPDCIENFKSAWSIRNTPT